MPLRSSSEPVQDNPLKSTYNIALTITGQPTSCGYIALYLYLKQYHPWGGVYWYKVGEALHLVDGTGTVNVPMNGIVAVGEMKLSIRYHSNVGGGSGTCEGLRGYSVKEFLYSGGSIPASINIDGSLIID